jgi:hypothetical protein
MDAIGYSASAALFALPAFLVIARGIAVGAGSAALLVEVSHVFHRHRANDIHWHDFPPQASEFTKPATRLSPDPRSSSCAEERCFGSLSATAW